MSLYEGAKTRVRVDSELSDELEAKVGVHHAFLLSRSLFLQWKSKVMASGSITKDGLYKGKVDPCGVCSLMLKANSVLCLQ